MNELDSQSQQRTPLLGCIADDVTGATDLATNLVDGGMCVVQVLGVPSAEQLRRIEADAIVVALKTRSVSSDKAVSQSLAALNSLQEAGMQRFFFKYCSTFDSTERGNIGPVAAALMAALGERQAVFCPAFPRNGRTVVHGHLFVHGVLLNESGMQHHPLNPMTDPNLVRFLGRQVDCPVGLVSYVDLENDQLRDRLDALAADGKSMVIVDSGHDDHLRQIAEGLAGRRLVTGGSGVARYLPAAYRATGLLKSSHYSPRLPESRGPSLLLSGSCSAATLEQVAWMQTRCPAMQIQIEELMRDKAGYVDRVVAWAQSAGGTRQPLLIYSSATAAEVEQAQRRFGGESLALAIEAFMADIAEALVARQGIRQLVLAGGETSGAVVNRLGIHSLRIGPEICSGVPWTESQEGTRLAVALKSGNFGDKTFFSDALGMLA